MLNAPATGEAMSELISFKRFLAGGIATSLASAEQDRT
jgi:hypothetical protein